MKTEVVFDAKEEKNNLQSSSQTNSRVNLNDLLNRKKIIDKKNKQKNLIIISSTAFIVITLILIITI